MKTREEQIISTEYSELMQKSYIDYAMSVIIARALQMCIRDRSYEPARKNLESFAGEMTRHKWDYGEQVPGGAGAERKEEFKIA